MKPALLVVGVFLLFALNPRNQALGVFLLPVGLGLMLYATFMPKAVEPELTIFEGLLLKLHILTTLVGYAAWAVTFAASVCYLYLERKRHASSRGDSERRRASSVRPARTRRH